MSIPLIPLDQRVELIQVTDWIEITDGHMCYAVVRPLDADSADKNSVYLVSRAHTLNRTQILYAPVPRGALDNLKLNQYGRAILEQLHNDPHNDPHNSQERTDLSHIVDPVWETKTTSQSSRILGVFPSNSAAPVSFILPQHSTISSERCMNMKVKRQLPDESDLEEPTVKAARKTVPKKDRLSNPTQKSLRRHPEKNKATTRSINYGGYKQAIKPASDPSTQPCSSFQNSNDDGAHDEAPEHPPRSRFGTDFSAHRNDHDDLSSRDLASVTPGYKTPFKSVSALWDRYQQSLAELRVLEERKAARLAGVAGISTIDIMSAADETHAAEVQKYVDNWTYEESDDDYPNLETKLAGFNPDDMYPGDSHFFDEEFARTVGEASPGSTK